MSTDLKKSNSTLENVPDPLKAAPELEEGEIANEEPTISPTRLKASQKESKSSSKKQKHKITVLYPISSGSDSSDAEEESRKGWWHKKKLHASSSQLSSSEAKEEDSSDDEYIEKPMPDFTTFRNRNRNYRKRKNRKRKEYKNKTQDFSNDSPLSSTSKEDNPETKKKKLYPCKSYIAFGKCDDIKCRCIHAPLNKEEELHRFIDENEEFFSNALKDFPNSQLNPSLLQFLSQKFGPPKSQNTLHLNLNLNKNESFTRPMPPPKFFSPQLPHSHYPIYNPSPPHIHPGYSFPMPQVFSPQNNNLNPSFPRPQAYGNPSIYFEFNMQQNLTYLPQDPRIFSPQPVFLNDISMQKQPNTLLPTSIISPNNKQCQSEIVQMQFIAEPRPGTMNLEPENKVNGSPNKTQTTFPNCFIASKDAPAMMRRRQSSIDTAPGSETHECHEKVISPDQDISAGGNQEKEEEIKKAKTAEKITKLVELFKAKQMNKQKQEEGDKAQEKKNDDMFKQWEETSPSKKPQMKSKFENESANDELLKKIKSALAESSTSSESGSGNVKDLVNMYLKMSKNLIMENNSIH